MTQEINAFAWNAEIDLLVLTINLIVGLILGMILRWHFKKFGSVLSNRDELGQILPIVTLTIILIISIVKSSLALSLGLVGALSIVRFRTPIKEPEELAYLFISIGIGLGLGAGQRQAVFVAFIIIITAITFIKWHKRSIKTKNMHLALSWIKDEKDGDSEIAKINDILFAHSSLINLRRFDIVDNNSQLDYIIDLKTSQSLDLLVNDLKKNFKQMNITFLDQNNMPRL